MLGVGSTQRCCRAAGRPLADRGRALLLLRWLTISLTCAAAPGPAVAQGARPADAPFAVQVVDVLDDAAAELDRPGADVRGVLDHALRALPAAAPKETRAGIERFLDRLPAAGDDFRCGADFLRWRALAEVSRLIDAARGEPVPPGDPIVCYALPYAVDASRAPRRVEIFGFDLDRVETEMVLVSKGRYRDVSAALVRRSPTHLSFDLDSAGAALAPDDDLLGLAWGNVVHYRIPVIQPTTPLCRSWVETIEATQLELSPPLLDEAPPVPPRGRVRALLSLDHVMNKVEANLCASLSGTRVHAGCSLQFVRTVDADRIIEGLVGPPSSRLDAVATPGHRSAGTRARAGPVRRWSWEGLWGGEATRISAELGAITVVSSDKERCIAAVDFLEAQRVGALAADTVRRLGPQVERMPAVIRRMRPRFAPGSPHDGP